LSQAATITASLNGSSRSTSILLLPPVDTSGGNTTFTPIRIHAGGGAYTDSAGQVWAADTGYLNGWTYSNPAQVANTADSGLYQTERWNTGTVQYRLSVPNGTYNVTLKFAEIWFNTAGQRVFNTVLNGSVVDSQFDPAAAAGGAYKAIDRTYTVIVTTGQIAIDLVPVISNPKVSAIEITMGSTPTFAPIRVRAGGGAYTDGAGHVWAADTGYVNGSTYSTSVPIANTTTPALYQAERWNSGTLQYRFAVPNGNYNVNLKFAEIYFNTAGQRVFNITLNGQLTQPNFDPFTAAGGAYRPVDRAYPVSVTNGQIAIDLVPVISNPKISAIEITPASSFIPLRVNAGGSDYTDSTGLRWSADTAYTNGMTYTTGLPITDTTTPVLYQSERWNSTTLQYRFTVPNGNYTVRLKFAEIYYSAPGMRIFNIILNGQTVDTHFDPLAAAGGQLRAIDRTYPVNVTNGQIAIDLLPVVSNPKISAIEITAP
jgi:hypothetical protein